VRELSRTACPSSPPPGDESPVQERFNARTNMSFRLLAFLAAFSAAFAGMGLNAAADTPGSLLVYPYFDNTRGDLTLITLVNTSNDQVNGTINVEFVYVNETTCLEFNRTRTLTPGDELSVITKYDDPNMTRGYVYVFAKSKTTGVPIAFDHLIGTEIILTTSDSDPDFSNAPVVFQAGAGLTDGSPTDINNNGLRDLDGIEYTKAPDQLLFPRFFGQGGPGNWHSQAVFINLTGGAQFQAIINLLIYNDNEEVFSAQFQFQCWVLVDLLDISSVFSNSFLLSTNHDPTEVYNGGHAFNEVGWFSVDGDVSFSTAAQFDDPAVLGLLIERGSTAEGPSLSNGGALLPFTLGTQSNGSLLSTNIFGT
jgi:hypothetical protein